MPYVALFLRGHFFERGDGKMKYLTNIFGVAALAGLSLLVGCNETTRKDVTSAQQKVENEKRKLDEAKREEARTTNKPVVDQPDQRGADRAHDKVIKQEQRVQDAKTEEARREQELNADQARDKFLIDCKASIDLANRSIEKLETKKNAADDEGKKAIDQQISDLKTKRDAVQKEINNVRGADKMRWADFQSTAQKAK